MKKRRAAESVMPLCGGFEKSCRGFILRNISFEGDKTMLFVSGGRVFTTLKDPQLIPTLTI